MNSAVISIIASTGTIAEIDKSGDGPTQATLEGYCRPSRNRAKATDVNAVVIVYRLRDIENVGAKMGI